MTPEPRAGRAVVLSYLTVTMALCVGVVAVYAVARGTDRLPAQLVRVALTAWLCVGVYRGNAVAKWVAVILYSLGGAEAFAAAFAADAGGAAFMGFLAAVYLSFAAVLMGSRPVNAFLAYQRTPRAADAEPAGE